MSIKQVWIARGQPGLAQTTTYGSLFGNPFNPSTTEANVTYYLRNGSTMLNYLTIYILTNTLDAAGTFALRASGVTKNLSISIPSGSTGLFQDINRQDTIPVNAYINYIWSSSSTTGSAGAQFVSVTSNPSSNFILYTQFGGNSTISSDAYKGINGEGNSTTEVNVQSKFRQAGTLKYSQIKVSANTSSTTMTCRIRKNSANGNNVISITASSTGLFEDTSNTDTVSVGDLINWNVTGVTVGSVSCRSLGISFISNDAKINQLVANGGAVVTNGTTVYQVIASSNGTANATEATRQVPIDYKYSFNNMEVGVQTNTTTSANTINLRVNGVNSALTISVTAGTTGFFADTTHTVTGFAGDLVSAQYINGGGGDYEVDFFGLTSQDTHISAHQIYINKGLGTTLNATATIYWGITEPSLGGSSTTETDKYYYLRTDGGAFSNLALYISANTLSVAGTYRFRRNGANGSQSISIGAGITGLFEDFSNIDACLKDDFVDLQWAGGGGTGTASVEVTSVALDPDSNTRFYGPFTSSVNLSDTTQNCLSIGSGNANDSDANEAFTQARFKVAGTLKNLQLNIASNNSTTTLTVASRINGVTGNLAISVTTLSTGYFQDSTHTDSVAVDDLVNLRSSGGSGGSTVSTRSYGVAFTSNDSRSNEAVAASNTAVGAGNTRYGSIVGLIQPNQTSEVTVQTPLDFYYSISKASCYISANATTSASTLDIRVNAVSTSLSISITAGTTGRFEDTVHSVSGHPRDKINCRFVNGGGGSFTVKELSTLMQEIDTPAVIRKVLYGNRGPNGGISLAANDTQYFSIMQGVSGNTSATESLEYAYLRLTTATFSNLSAYIKTNTLSITGTIRFRVNGADGNQSLSITASTTGLFVDSTNQDSSGIGDTVNHKWTAGAGTGSASVSFVTVLCSPATNFSITGVFYSQSTAWQNSNSQYKAFDTDTVSSTESDVQQRIRTAGRFSYLEVDLITNNNTNPFSTIFRVNGVDTNLRVSYPASTTGYFTDLNNSAFVAVGDNVNVHNFDTSIAGTMFITHWTVSFVPDSESIVQIVGSLGTGGVAAGTTRYVAILGGGGAATVEAESQMPVNFAYSTSDAFVNITTNTTTGGSSSYTFRKNGADTSLSISVTAGTTGVFSDTTNTVNGGAGDLVDWKFINGGGAGNVTTTSYSMLMTPAQSSIKTINGLAKGSIKIINGLAIASMKTRNGLS